MNKMVKFEEQIPKKLPTNSSKLVKPIIPLARPEKDELDASEYIDHTCHNTPGDTTSGKYVIKIPRFDSGTPEEWIIFVDLIQKSLVGQNVTTGPPMYECMERVLKGDAKAEFLQQANLVGSRTVANFTTVMATMTVHVFPTYAYRDQRRYMQRYLKKPHDMKVRSFTTRLIQLNTYLPYFPPDRPGQQVTSLPDDDIKEILYHAMPNTWKKKMIEQGYNYLDGPIHAMAEFFETRIENLEKSIPPSVPSRNNKKKSKKGKKKEDSEEEHVGHKFCQYHGMCGHTTDECTTLKALVKQAKQKKGKHFQKKKRFTKHEVNIMVQKEVKKAMKKKKKKRTEDLRAFEKMSVSDSDQESSDSSSSEDGEI